MKVTSEIDFKLDIYFRSVNPASTNQITHTKEKAITTLNKKGRSIKNNVKNNNNINEKNNQTPLIQTVITSSSL